MSKKNDSDKVEINLKGSLIKVSESISMKGKGDNKQPIREKSVIIESEDDQLKVRVTVTGKKSTHPLKNWEEGMFLNEEDMRILLELPKPKQKKITDFTDKKEK